MGKKDTRDLNEKLHGRVFNWKFESALQYIEGAKSFETKPIVEALAKCFGDLGWEDGLMATIIGAAVENIYRLEGWEVED